MPSLLLTQGTILTIKSSGGDATITPTSIANDAARQSTKLDLGANWARAWNVLFTSSTASAPTDFNEIELWFGFSSNATAGTDNPGNLVGTDSTWANPDKVKFQARYIGSIILANVLGTGIQKQDLSFFPKTRYLLAGIVNTSGLSLGSTAADHLIQLTPAEDLTV